MQLAFVSVLPEWNALINALLATIIFGLVGIGLMLLGFKLFDLITPRIHLEKELAENKNIAVAIVTAAVIIGVAIIVAAAMS